MTVTTHYNTFKRYHLFASKWLSMYIDVYFADTLLPFHDHPWWNITVRLWGHFAESLIPNYMSLDRGKETTHVNPRFVFRRATTGHKMKMLKGIPLVTIFITGPEWNVVGGKA